MTPDQRALNRNHSVLRYLLDQYATEHPTAPFVHFWPSTKWDYKTTRDCVRQRAATLKSHGVKRGDHVLCFMGNGPDLLTTGSRSTISVRSMCRSTPQHSDARWNMYWRTRMPR